MVGAVLKNTGGTGFARLQLDANNSTDLVRLEAASAGSCTLDAPEQEIWLQNRPHRPDTAHSGDERHCHHSSGQNDLSDEKVKRNVRDADLDELQTIFDRAAKRYDRVDTDKGQAGLLGPEPAVWGRHRKDDGTARSC